MHTHSMKRKENVIFHSITHSVLAFSEVKAQILVSDIQFMVFFVLTSCSDISVVHIIMNLPILVRFNNIGSLLTRFLCTY